MGMGGVKCETMDVLTAIFSETWQYLLNHKKKLEGEGSRI